MLGALTVSTISNNATNADVLVGEAGLIAGNDGTARSTVDANHFAQLGDANITVAGAVQVNATATGNAHSNVGELAVGLASGGFADPDSLVEGTIQALVNDGATIQAPSLAVAATGTSVARSDADAIGVGILSGNATGADANTNVFVLSHIDNATILVPGAVTVTKRQRFGHGRQRCGEHRLGCRWGVDRQRQDGRRESGLPRSAGSNITAGTSTSGDNGSGSTQTNADAFGGGIVAGNAARSPRPRRKAPPKRMSPARYQHRDDTGDATVAAMSSRLSNANSGSTAGGRCRRSLGGERHHERLDLGVPRSARHAPGNLHITATDSDSLANAIADAFKAGIATGNGSSANATRNSPIRAYAGNGTNLTAVGNLLVQAQSLGAVVNADSEGTNISLFHAGSSIARGVDSPVVEASLRTGATVDSGSITVESTNTLLVSMALADTSGGSLVGINATAVAESIANVSSYIGRGDGPCRSPCWCAQHHPISRKPPGMARPSVCCVGDVNAQAQSGNQTQAYGSGACG